MKTALIFGVTGQDGSYLSELLLNKNYVVHGVKRRSSSLNTERIDHIYQEPIARDRDFILHYGDLGDIGNIIALIQKTQPDEIYNLAAMSHVKVSFELPEYTANTVGLGTLRILEAIRILNLKKIRFFQASSSEMFGSTMNEFQNENTPFNPVSPYATSKVFAYHTVKNYRQAYQLFAANGIFFNHESPRRGETFLTRKVSQGVAQIVTGKRNKIYLGNLDARRDWGHAKDYCQAMWSILQLDEPIDLVIGSGESYSIKEFCIQAFKTVGISIEFIKYKDTDRGLISSMEKQWGNLKIGNTVIETSKQYLRPNEVPFLCADTKLAKEKINWNPDYKFTDLVEEMVRTDLKLNGVVL